MKLEIKHDAENQKFFAIIEGKEAYLEYIISDLNIINMIKTYVPPELRGKGIAEKIVNAAFLFAKEKKYKVIPSCSYINTYIKRNPEFENLIIEN